MKEGLYIINYHNVDWEDSVLTQAVSGTIRPDVFKSHLNQLQSMGELISIQEGMERLEQGGDFDKPFFCLWFDDGFSGVRKYALPTCRQFGITAAMSICSEFVLKKEMYWRCKLSFLAMTDGMRFLRSKIQKEHGKIPLRIRKWLVENFSKSLLEIIDTTYEQFTDDLFREDAFRIFDDQEGIRQLKECGWMITNHSKAHYPITKSTLFENIVSDFQECHSVVEQFEPDNRFWVLPFGSGVDYHLGNLRKRAFIILVGEKRNDKHIYNQGYLYRVSPPISKIINFEDIM